jgi:hypothetical protein
VFSHAALDAPRPKRLESKIGHRPRHGCSGSRIASEVTNASSRPQAAGFDHHLTKPLDRDGIECLLGVSVAAESTVTSDLALIGTARGPIAEQPVPGESFA